MKSAYCQVECKVETLYLNRVLVRQYVSSSMKRRDEVKNNMSATRSVLYSVYFCLPSS